MALFFLGSQEDIHLNNVFFLRTISKTALIHLESREDLEELLSGRRLEEIWMSPNNNILLRELGVNPHCLLAFTTLFDCM